MAHQADLERIQEEMVTEFRFGNEERVRILVSQLGKGRRQVRSVLETMLDSPDSLVRQVAAFGLGELGGATSAKRLEHQLALEEARGDHAGEAVIEDISRALGKIGDTSARAALVRRLERLAAGKPKRSDVNDLAYPLWRRRHPDLIPIVRRNMEMLSLPEPNNLQGLLILLEKSPEALDAWARDPAVPVELKLRVLVVLEEDVPGTHVPVLPAFIAMADALREQAREPDSNAANYCDRLFSLLLGDRERLIGALPEEARAKLRAVTRNILTAPPGGPFLGAAVVLGLVGHPEDVELLQSRRPADDPVFAEVFDDAAETIRNRH